MKRRIDSRNWKSQKWNIGSWKYCIMYFLSMLAESIFFFFQRWQSQCNQPLFFWLFWAGSILSARTKGLGGLSFVFKVSKIELGRPSFFHEEHFKRCNAYHWNASALQAISSHLAAWSVLEPVNYAVLRYRQPCQLGLGSQCLSWTRRNGQDVPPFHPCQLTRRAQVCP